MRFIMDWATKKQFFFQFLGTKNYKFKFEAVMGRKSFDGLIAIILPSFQNKGRLEILLKAPP